MQWLYASIPPHPVPYISYHRRAFARIALLEDLTVLPLRLLTTRGTLIEPFARRLAVPGL